eukprot:TRINITY_DN41117_c0_g1_i1.p1 TRINITY_DN41117_c0_g1~~TRINITY_DN41117_c0_g1_i1.p1  ORF type:complete len:530 (+),score=104.91 TRINITY_DN41117_c0_g1_i1:32-1621(+)
MVPSHRHQRNAQHSRTRQHRRFCGVWRYGVVMLLAALISISARAAPQRCLSNLGWGTLASAAALRRQRKPHVSRRQAQHEAGSDSAGAIAGLQEAFAEVRLPAEARADGIRWCQEQGAATLPELLENFDALVRSMALPAADSQRFRIALSKAAAKTSTIMPEQALLFSPTLRPALQALLRLLRANSGTQDIDGLLERALQQLRSGALDWDSLLGDSAPWDAARMPKVEVKERCQAALRLLTIGNNLAEEVTVSAGSNLAFNGTWQGPAFAAGRDVPYRLGKSPDDHGWGKWASYFVLEGPEPLVGRRLVACKRASKGEFVFGDADKMQLQKGDSLFFATADRSALLELVAFDQLPEFAGELARLLRDGEADMAGIVAPPEIREAAEFVNRIRSLSEGEQAHQRYQRLQESPLGQRLALLAAGDGEWAEFGVAAAHRQVELYEAIRSAMLRVRPVEQLKPRRVPVPVAQIGLLPVLGLLALLAFVVWGIWRFSIKPAEVTDLPMYTLQGSPPTRMAPPLSGTPLMPFQSK